MSARGGKISESLYSQLVVSLVVIGTIQESQNIFDQGIDLRLRPPEVPRQRRHGHAADAGYWVESSVVVTKQSSIPERLFPFASPPTREW